jgi:hypothetical protein
VLRPEGRTAAEVTAAAERTADLALRCVRLTAERDRARDIAVALEGQVAAVRALADEWGLVRLASTRHRVEQLRAALDPDPADRGTGERP